MYCKHCGKEIADDSRFCQHCGGSQSDILSISFLTLVSYWNKHKIVASIWLAWALLHLSLLFSSSGTFDGTGNIYFYPFNHSLSEVITGDYLGKLRVDFFDSCGLDYYDFSEFFFYVILLPLALFSICKLLTKVSIGGSKNAVTVKKGICILFGCLIYLSTLATIIIMLIGLYNSEARYAFNVEEMGNPSSGWYIRHPNSMLYAYHLMDCLLIYSILFVVVVLSFIAFYFTRICKSNVSLPLMDRVTVWSAKIGVSLFLGNMIALIIAIPTSQSVSSIGIAFFFFLVSLILLSTGKINTSLKL